MRMALDDTSITFSRSRSDFSARMRKARSSDRRWLSLRSTEVRSLVTRSMTDLRDTRL